jgi:hypothetical protein
MTGLKVVMVWFGAIGAMTIALFLNDPVVTYSSFWKNAPTAPNAISLVMLLFSACLLKAELCFSMVGRKAVRVTAAIAPLICAILIACLNVSNLLAMNYAAKMGQAELSVDGEIAYLNGDIDRELPERIKWLIESEKIRLVIIDSLGGLDGAARVIAKALNSHHIAVRAARECASACLTLWANAAKRESYPHTRFGIHKAHLGDGRSPGLMAGLFMTTIDRKLMGDLVAIGFPPELANTAFHKPTEVVTWIEGVELEQTEVKLKIIR